MSSHSLMSFNILSLLGMLFWEMVNIFVYRDYMADVGAIGTVPRRDGLTWLQPGFSVCWSAEVGAPCFMFSLHGSSYRQEIQCFTDICSSFVIIHWVYFCCPHLISNSHTDRYTTERNASAIHVPSGSHMSCYALQCRYHTHSTHTHTHTLYTHLTRDTHILHMHTSYHIITSIHIIHNTYKHHTKHTQTHIDTGTHRYTHSHLLSTHPNYNHTHCSIKLCATQFFTDW